MEEPESQVVSGVVESGPRGGIAERERIFAEQHARFAMRFRCEDCAHLIASTMRCSMGYPNTDLIGPLRGLGDNGLPTSCKYWELSESA